MSDILASLPPEFKYSHPALQPPPGIQTNFNSKVSRGPIVLIIGSILFALMITGLAIRIYVRFWINRQASWGDVSCIIAALGATVYFADLVIAVTTSSLGRHLYDVRISEIDDHFIVTIAYLSVVLVLPVLLAAKLTLFSLYYEIFHPFRWMRICVYIGVAVTVVFHVAAGITQVVLSTPKAGETWLSHVYGKDEVAAQNNAVPLSSVGLVIDVYLLILPIKAVMDLQLPARRKIAVGVVFFTGILACIASSLSIWLRVIYVKASDVTWLAPYVILCTLTEMNIGVLVACMPATPNFFNRVLPQIKALQLSLRFSQFRSENEAKTKATGYSSQPVSIEQGFDPESQSNPSYGRTSPFREYEMNQGSGPPYELDHLQRAPYELENSQSISTDIRSTNPSRSDTSDDRIHLKREVRQV